MELSIGKWRRLQQLATPAGTFTVLALDHRGNLRRVLNPDNPESVADRQIVEIKRDIIAGVASASSAVLLDPETGYPAALTGNDGPNAAGLSGATGLIATLDATGYSGDPHVRISEVLPGWSVEQAVMSGALGIKLLVYYHPEAANANTQERLVKEVATACTHLDVPFFLEPLSFSIDPDVKKISSAERRQVVIETARRLVPLGADILKAEFPLDVAEDPDEDAWQAACLELTSASQVPWLLLSAGVSYEVYLRQVRVACEAGASGVMAGRAVWKEALEHSGAARRIFLQTTALSRMQKLSSLCDALGKPFTDVYPPPQIPEGWYTDYHPSQ